MDQRKGPGCTAEPVHPSQPLPMPCVTSTGSPCRDLTRSVHPRQRLELPCLPLLPGASGLLSFLARSPRRIQPYTAHRAKTVGSCRKIRLYSPGRCVVNPGTGGGIPTQPAQTSFIRTAGQERGHPPSAFQLESTREHNRLPLRDKLTPVCFFFNVSSETKAFGSSNSRPWRLLRQAKEPKWVLKRTENKRTQSEGTK